MKKLFLFSFMLMSLFALAQTDFIQTDWSGGPGQTVFNDNTKFNSSFNVDYSSFPGDLIAQNNFKTHVYGVVEYQGKLLITTGWTGTYIYDPVTLEWEFSQIAVTINYQNSTIHSDGLLYILQGRTIYRYDGSHNDYGMGPNGWELHSDITPLGIQSVWTIKSVQDKLLIGCRNYSYSARVIEFNESTQSWNIMGNAFTQGVCSLIEYNGVIYAGTHWSGQVYKWTGSSWIQAFDTPSMSIINMEVHNGDLYLAGGNDFSWGRLYKYNGNSLVTIASYSGYRVYDLESHGDVLAFTIQGNSNSSGVLQYDGTAVSVLYPYGGERTSVQLCSYQGDLYYGGIQGTSTSIMYKNGIEFETIYVKGVFSSEFPTANGQLNVEATTAEGNGVKIFVQGKNNANYTASPWVEIPDGEAVPISDDIMRYWAILYTVGEGPGPVLHEISIGYQATEPLEISLISKTDINCYGDETGAIDISVSGGTEPYSFIWSNGAITEDLNNIQAGSYSVIVSDADENTLLAEYLLIEPDVLSIICPEDIIVNSLENECGISVDFSASVLGGTNPILTYSNSPGSFFPVGITTITATATDDCASVECSFNITVTDDVAPIALCQNINITLSDGVASISPEMVDNGSYDACGIASLDIDISSFNCSDIGDNIIELTVTDNNGNVSTCESIVSVIGEIPSCEIDVELANDTYTGGDGFTIFLGYGPQSLTVTSNAQGGGPFTYEWSGGNGFLSSTSSANPEFSPTVDGVYTLVCLLTNSHGCETMSEVEICVKDIRASGNGNGNGNNQKVYLCHVPKGNPNKAKTLRISVNAVPRHLNKHSGDALGYCGQECGGFKIDFESTDFEEDHAPELSVYPNPTLNTFNIILDSHSTKDINIKVYDQLGKKVISLQNLDANSLVELGEELSPGFYYIHVVQGEYTENIKVVKSN